MSRDLNVFAAYLFDTGNPAVSFGIGPNHRADRPNDRLGSEKWSAGFANVLFDGRSKQFQYGYLLTWQASFAGSDDSADVNTGAFQPFAFYQLGKGLYLRSTPIWVYNSRTTPTASRWGSASARSSSGARPSSISSSSPKPRSPIAVRGSLTGRSSLASTCNFSIRCLKMGIPPISILRLERRDSRNAQFSMT